MKNTASMYKALGDETRLQMLWLLMNHRELCVCDFMEVLGITQSKTSRHLRTLYHAGLVDDRRQGLWVYYSLRQTEDALMRSTLRAMKTNLASRPEAQELLASLESWLERKAEGESCAS
ncbi:MAG: winged helix-turn-helix transcriptional regulator [Deltaproteobacteria bacterium]|nr:winged helix-turn-helix transcriptional regulator [Deltaproteobacteria bacterium]